MGGRALKSAYTERKTTEQFKEIEQKLLPILQQGLDTELYIVKCFHTKETHGDMDILVRIDEKFHNRKLDLREFVKDTFSPNEIFTNGGVVSFDYDEFQIDLIPVRESNWETAKCYYDMDPTGNIQGKVANSIKFRYKRDTGLEIKGRLSYGFNGLSAVIYGKDTDKKLGEVLLSKDNYNIFSFLGYDYNTYLKGFDTLTDIFEFSTSTEYFKRERFLMENLSHKDRKRNRKRKTYHDFLAYVDDNEIPDKPDLQTLTPGGWLNKIDVFFINADLKSKVNQMIDREEKNKLIRGKFNGHILMEEFPELRGEELGTWIGNFKRDFDDAEIGQDWYNYAISHTKEEILDEFTMFYKGVI